MAAPVDIETADGPPPHASATRERPAELLALVVLWSAAEPERVGEILVAFPGTTSVLGRGPAQAGDKFVHPMQQRPGANLATRAFADKFLSRRHLLIESDDGALVVTSVGKRPLLVGGEPIEKARLREDDVVAVKDVLLLSCVRRPPEMAIARHGAVEPEHRFGEPDAHGIVGESVAAWRLRESMSFIASKRGHVLLTGVTGSGKELVARALHVLSPRRSRKFVGRNAATLPPGLVDAELFGNIAAYPHAGMPERPGLVGEAEGGTLFLDEIGELSTELQTHLLRVLDDGAEYQRLGESRRRLADLRLIAATNRAAEDLKPDLAARLAFRIEVPGLDARREDIPLIINELLRRAATEDPEVGRRFSTTKQCRLQLNVSCALVEALVTHEYRGHVRELGALLWRAIEESEGNVLELTSGVERDLGRDAKSRRSSEVGDDEVRAALQRHGGVQAKAWRELGLPNRFALRRLMKSYGIKPTREED